MKIWHLKQKNKASGSKQKHTMQARNREMGIKPNLLQKQSIHRSSWRVKIEELKLSDISEKITVVNGIRERRAKMRKL